MLPSKPIFGHPNFLFPKCFPKILYEKLSQRLAGIHFTTVATAGDLSALQCNAVSTQVQNFKNYDYRGPQILSDVSNHWGDVHPSSRRTPCIRLTNGQHVAAMMPQFMWLVISLLTRKLVFDSRAIHTRLMMDKLAIGRFSLRVLGIRPVDYLSINPALSHSFTYHGRCIIQMPTTSLHKAQKNRGIHLRLNSIFDVRKHCVMTVICR